jgi:putative addiction module CopG family antidote
MNVTLTPRHKRYITGKVKSGAYGSAEEVIREGLRLLESEDERQRRLVWLQAEVEKGFAGPMTPWTRKDSERVRRLITKRNAKGR